MSGRTNKKRIVIALTTIAVIGLFLLTFFVPDHILSFRFGQYTLSGDTPAVVHHSQLERHADANEKLRIIVGLKLHDEAELDKLLSELANPASPNYRKYITPEAFAQRFSPTPGEVDAVVGFLKANGITVVKVTPNRTLVIAEGTVAQLEAAFSVTINRYTIKEHSGATRSYLSNDRDPSIPAKFEHIIESVIGLDTYAEFKSRMRKEPRQQSTKPYGLSPQEAATIYQFPNANNSNITGTKLTGAGKTLAIATAYGYDPKDVEAYLKQFNIVRTGTITDVHINGKYKQINEETTLDLETAAGQAPGADIMMYMAVDPRFVNFTEVFNQIVTDNKADVMSISWGLCEENTGKRQMKTEQKIFKQGAAQGIAIFAAAGDDGAYDCKEEEKKDDEKDQDPKPPVTPKLAVDYPSSDPYVTAVGGTFLLNNGGKRIAEWAWTGTGGGVSDYWPRPSWQSGPGVPAGDKRVTSDVALDASPSSGYSFYYEGKWHSWGGTSVGAPEWAALWILIDEAANERIGMPNETFYRVGASSDYATTFHDITSGDNGDYRGPGYKSGPNWDHPTGWGVPKGEALKDWIVKDRSAQKSKDDDDK